jgi:predicted N-acetyltransferase YhbS
VTSRYHVDALSDRHELTQFDSGNNDLDVWLRDHARTAASQGTRTYVLIEDESTDVVGYFALAPHLVEREALPRRIGRGGPRQVPAILLAKLAVVRRLHGAGLGSDLLLRALSTALTAARAAGGKLLVVDAINAGAAAFYEAHDFQPVPGNPRRLVIKLSTVAKELGAPWP